MLVGKKNIFDKLLGQRAAALYYFTRADVYQQSAQNAVYGDSAMLVKGVVLNGYQRLGYILIHSVQRRPIRALTDWVDYLVHIEGQIKFLHRRRPFLFRRQQADKERHSGRFFMLIHFFLLLLRGCDRLGLIRKRVVADHAGKNQERHYQCFYHAHTSLVLLHYIVAGNIFFGKRIHKKC